MGKKRVAVAMSGGVDSSVAAALLVKEGYDVIGITHQIWPSEKQSFGGCCGLDAIDSARAVANKLSIPYYVLDLRQEFADKVISVFCREYGAGRTPNPCVLCNQFVRFGIMLDKVLKMGIDAVATGHYVRLVESSGSLHLYRSSDSKKDQSYFLYTLDQNILSYLLFPVGGLEKTEVRRLATELGLPSASRKDSQDICFIQQDYRSFLMSNISLNPGDIVDISGRVIGKHEGLGLYTIGQRHGLNIAGGEPLYVIRLDKDENRVVVGPQDALYSDILTAVDVNWISGSPPAVNTPVTARVRYHAPRAEAALTLTDNGVKVIFKQPQMAIAPGQSVVFYSGDEVLGGGIIK